jgi:pimeloyl-ACP methyl ester carboxylesterase
LEKNAKTSGKTSLSRTPGALPVQAVVGVKAKGATRASVGVAACIVGFILARASPYRQATLVVDANGCRLVTDVIDKGSDAVAGSVVLLHGVAANKKIMAYLADAFAEQGLRVFVPDLPGHGRTPGPFSFARAETCTEFAVRQLAARGLIDTRRTILAGHSMGGAIAVRVAARVDIAGVIAVSPAPMRERPGIPADLLPYRDAPARVDNALVISAEFEPFSIRAAAQDLVVAATSATSKFLLIPRATHASVLFDSRVARACEDWAAHALGLQPSAALPSSRMVFGSLIGFAGVLLLSGPFLRETQGTRPEIGHARREESSAEASAGDTNVSSTDQAQGGAPVLLELQRTHLLRGLLEIAAASLLAVVVLKFWNPLSFLRLFNGGYFASFLLLTGLAILLAHYKLARTFLFADARARFSTAGGLREGASYIPLAARTLLAAAFGALALHLLVTGWLDATLTESWVSASRWTRFPVLLLAAFAYLLAEEVLLYHQAPRGKVATFALPLALRVVAWLPLVFAIFALHSGAILLFLLAPYIFLFFVLQSAGANVVRKQAGSPLASALFGAILLAAFCLVIFPVT